MADLPSIVGVDHPLPQILASLHFTSTTRDSDLQHYPLRAAVGSVVFGLHSSDAHRSAIFFLLLHGQPARAQRTSPRTLDTAMNTASHETAREILVYYVRKKVALRRGAEEMDDFDVFAQR